MTKNPHERQDELYMRQVLTLAAAMRGRTSPDPMVGSLIVKNKKIVSRGYHGEVTTPHAEAYALHKAGARARGATLYVNLEPCCHFGNNPPCTAAIIQSGIKRVVAAMTDPNPLVAGKGFKQLKAAGIDVVTGVLETEARRLNEIFIKFITKRQPFVILKTAMSLDGKIATSKGESRYISSPASREMVHDLRASVDGILTGVETVLRDDPRLDVRGRSARRGGNPPYKIVFDSAARTPASAALLRHAPERVLIVTTRKAPAARLKALRDRGAQIIIVKSARGGVDAAAALSELGSRGITSLLVEAGGRINATLVQDKLADKMVVFLAPKLIGGHAAPTPLEGDGIARLSHAVTLKEVRTRRIGPDFLVEGYL